jgi:hypothetical protein
MRSGKGYSWIFFIFFFYNHPEYIEKVIKLIVKAKYRNIKKKIHVEKQKERKKTNLLQKKK